MGWNYLSKLQRLHRWNSGIAKQYHSTIYDGCNYFSMPGFKLNHVTKRGPWCICVNTHVFILLCKYIFYSMVLLDSDLLIPNKTICYLISVCFLHVDINLALVIYGFYLMIEHVYFRLFRHLMYTSSFRITRIHLHFLLELSGTSFSLYQITKNNSVLKRFM